MFRAEGYGIMDHGLPYHWNAKPFSMMVAPYLTFNSTRNIFELLLTKEYVLAIISAADDIGEAPGPVSEKEELVAEV